MRLESYYGGELMQLHATLFAGQFTDRHARLARVLELSAAENSPATPLTIHRIDDPDTDLRDIARPKCKAQWIDNARKAKHHNRIIQEAANGELLCMIDTDTMVLGDLSEAELMDFDLAYTVRPPGNKYSRWKLNTGVYFVRVSDITKAWCIEWYRNVRYLLQNEWHHQHWKATKGYGGIHQAALGMMLEREQQRYALTLAELPCATWNCVSGTWDTADNQKVVHIMGSLRDRCFGPRKAKTDGERLLVERWKGYDSIA